MKTKPIHDALLCDTCGKRRATRAVQSGRVTVYLCSQCKEATR